MTPEQVQHAAVETIRHHSQEGSRAYYEWLRTGLTIASGALALLVGFQGSYLPKHPVSLWMLQGGWICLCLTIISGVVAFAVNPLVAFERPIMVCQNSSRS